jgi:hypothetical protein
MAARVTVEDKKPLLADRNEERAASWRFYVTVIAGFFAQVVPRSNASCPRHPPPAACGGLFGARAGGWQGIVGSLPALAVSYYYKDNLSLDPDITAAVGSINTIPWTIKPVPAPARTDGNCVCDV